MIQEIQSWIWNIGGFLFSILLVLALCTWILSWILNRITGWHNKENRENLIYWIRNKKRLNEIIDTEKSKSTQAKSKISSPMVERKKRRILSRAYRRAKRFQK